MAEGSGMMEGKRQVGSPVPDYDQKGTYTSVPESSISSRTPHRRQPVAATGRKVENPIDSDFIRSPRATQRKLYDPRSEFIKPLRRSPSNPCNPKKEVDSMPWPWRKKERPPPPPPTNDEGDCGCPACATSSSGFCAVHKPHRGFDIPSPHSPDENFEDVQPELILQPDTRPISQEQLVTEVKGIYAGLVMVEAKCIEVDSKQAAAAAAAAASVQSSTKAPCLNNDQWQALIALYRTILHEHHDFFLASQHPPTALFQRKAATDSAMSAQMRRRISSLLEPVQHETPACFEHQLTFITTAISMMSTLYDSPDIPAFSNTWIELLGDLGRYKMAMEDKAESTMGSDFWGDSTGIYDSKRCDHHLTASQFNQPNTLQNLDSDSHNDDSVDDPWIQDLCHRSKSTSDPGPYELMRESMRVIESASTRSSVRFEWSRNNKSFHNPPDLPGHDLEHIFSDPWESDIKELELYWMLRPTRKRGPKFPIAPHFNGLQVSIPPIQLYTSSTRANEDALYNWGHPPSKSGSAGYTTTAHRTFAFQPSPRPRSLPPGNLEFATSIQAIVGEVPATQSLFGGSAGSTLINKYDQNTLKECERLTFTSDTTGSQLIRVSLNCGVLNHPTLSFTDRSRAPGNDKGDHMSLSARWPLQLIQCWISVKLLTKNSFAKPQQTSAEGSPRTSMGFGCEPAPGEDATKLCIQSLSLIDVMAETYRQLIYIARLHLIVLQYFWIAWKQGMLNTVSFQYWAYDGHVIRDPVNVSQEIPMD